MKLRCSYSLTVLENKVKYGQRRSTLVKLAGNLPILPEAFGPRLHKVIHRPKSSKIIERHNGPKLSPDQIGYGPEAARRTKGFQMTLLQHIESSLGKFKSRRRALEVNIKEKEVNREEDDLSQPCVCEEIDPFTLRIRYFDFSKTIMPSHIKTYDESKDPEDHIKIFQAAAKIEQWAMPTWCHMFNSTLAGNVRKKWIKDPMELHNIKQREMESMKDFVIREDEGIKGPMIIEAEIGGHCIQRMYVDSRPALEILYEYCFNKIRSEIKNQLMPATTPLIGFNGEIIWPIGQIQLLVKIRDEEHSIAAWMNFVVVRSPSPYNEIIGRSGVKKLQAVPSTAHGMRKLPVERGVITLKSSIWSRLNVPWSPNQKGTFRIPSK
nr:reverse transcriptase domain-containing protein [Tanacetum cinerariifolium]